jgi:plasmid stability protein
MRTTVRLPDDLYRQVRVRAAADGATVTAFIEAALRAALMSREAQPQREPYCVSPVYGGGLLPGVDLDDGAAMLDLMDADAGA